MINIIIMIVFIVAVSVGMARIIDNTTGMSKKHNNTMERLNINYIRTIQQTQQLFKQNNVSTALDSVVTYFVPCYPGALNKFRGKIKLRIWIHEYDVIKPNIDKSRQFLVMTKEQFFLMKLKGWIETTDKEEAIKAVSYLNVEVSLP